MASYPSVSPIFLFIFSIFLMSSCSLAKEYLVGGSEDSWKVPLPSGLSLNKWAKNHRFKNGDSLNWKYDHRSESVLQVKEKDYGSCNTSKPIEEYNDGDTKVVLEQSGPFYFISGDEGHCQKGLKLAVVVMSKTHGGISHSPSPAPSPSAIPPSIGGASGSSCNGFMGIIIGLGVSLAMMVTI